MTADMQDVSTAASPAPVSGAGEEASAPADAVQEKASHSGASHESENPLLAQSTQLEAPLTENASHGGATVQSVETGLKEPRNEKDSAGSASAASQEDTWLLQGTPSETHRNVFSSDLKDSASEKQPKSCADADISQAQDYVPERGLAALQMVLPVMARAVGNVVGGAVLAGGYALGKAEALVQEDECLADSKTFQKAFQAFLLTNGILHKVQYMPLGSKADEIRNFYNLPSLADDQKDAQNLRMAPIIVANHISYIDGMVLAAVLGAPRIVAMKGTSQVPLLGQLAKEIDVIFVDREDKDARKNTVNAIKDHTKDWEPGDRALLLFPEGTTSNGRGLRPFKVGAFIPGVPVRPVLIAYDSTWDPASVQYRENAKGEVEELKDSAWAWQFLGHAVHSLKIRVLPPYVPNETEQADPEVYANGVNTYMTAELRTFRQEVEDTSWKTASGRSSGGLGYTFGDEWRCALKRLQEHAMPKVSGSEASSGSDQAKKQTDLRQALKSRGGFVRPSRSCMGGGESPSASPKAAQDPERTADGNTTATQPPVAAFFQRAAASTREAAGRLDDTFNGLFRKRQTQNSAANS